MDVPSIIASTSDGGVPWFVSLAAEPLLLLQELHPSLNISALPPPPVPISLRSESSLQKRACSNGSTGSNSNGNNSNNGNNNNNSNNSNSNSNNNGTNSKSGGTSLVGPVVGAVVGTLVLAIFAFLIYRAVQRRKAARAAAAANNANMTQNPPTAVVTPFPPPQNFTPPPMKETGSYFGPGGTPNAYQVNMTVAHSTGAPSTYSGGSDNMSYYNAGGQTPGNAYFNQMPNPMPPQMPNAMSQNPPFNAQAPSPWNVNVGLPPVHPGQSPSPGIPYPASTHAPTFESSGISSTSSPPPMSPSVAGSNYAPWANPGAQAGSSSNTPVPMPGFMTAQQEKAQFSGAFPVSEKAQFSGVSAPVAPPTHAGGSGSGKGAEEAPTPAPASSSAQQRNSAANEEDAVPVGLPPPAYTFAAQ